MIGKFLINYYYRLATVGTGMSRWKMPINSGEKRDCATMGPSVLATSGIMEFNGNGLLIDLLVLLSHSA